MFTGGSTDAALPEQVERVKPSVVAVGTFSPTRNPRFGFRGTGFVVGDGTLVATNAHVVPDTLKSDERETISVALGAIAGRPPEVRTATLAGLDRDHDLALLRIAGSPLPALRIGDSSAVREGEAVAFTGFPIGSVLGLYPVTHRGLVSSVTPIVIPSATSRQLDAKIIRRVQSGAFEVFQLDATAYPGNSGSPVYLVDGDSIVGIINMVFVKGTKEAALTNPTGISFAIPTKYLTELLRTTPGSASKGASSRSTE
jgi:S1-C subfamily serine protease